MNTRLKITKIGNSAGVVLPRDLLTHLGASVGETLSVTKIPGGIELSVRPSSDFDGQMNVARDIMSRRKLALRELAATQHELAEVIMREDREILRALEMGPPSEPPEA